MPPPEKERTPPLSTVSPLGSCEHSHGHITVHICDGCFLLILLHRNAEGVSNVLRIITLPGIDLLNLSSFVHRLLTFLWLLIEDLENIQVEHIVDLPFKRDLIPQNLIPALLVPAKQFINAISKIRAAHLTTFALIRLSHTPAVIESGKVKLSLELLVLIADALNVSADDLLFDQLKHPSSPVGTELYDLLLDCNNDEKAILTKTVKFLKATLVEYGI